MREATRRTGAKRRPKLAARFFRTGIGREPVREWLKGLGEDDRKAIGDDILTVQYGWPLGMPLVRKIEDGLWEIRSDISNGIARVLFTMVEGETIVLLHGFVKKSQKLPSTELATARRRHALLIQKG